jgi:hypothetical protein
MPRVCSSALGAGQARRGARGSLRTWPPHAARPDDEVRRASMGLQNLEAHAAWRPWGAVHRGLCAVPTSWTPVYTHFGCLVGLSGRAKPARVCSRRRRAAGEELQALICCQH